MPPGQEAHVCAVVHKRGDPSPGSPLGFEHQAQALGKVAGTLDPGPLSGGAGGGPRRAAAVMPSGSLLSSSLSYATGGL